MLVFSYKNNMCILFFTWKTSIDYSNNISLFLLYIYINREKEIILFILKLLWLCVYFIFSIHMHTFCLIISEIRSSTQYRILFFLFILTITRKSQASLQKKKFYKIFHIKYVNVCSSAIHFRQKCPYKKYIHMHRCTNRWSSTNRNLTFNVFI